jgi:hypothetical protein
MHGGAAISLPPVAAGFQPPVAFRPAGALTLRRAPPPAGEESKISNANAKARSNEGAKKTIMNVCHLEIKKVNG